MEKWVLEVAAALIVKDGKVLLTRRHEADAQGGLWEFPGGAREEGESFAECLARELQEELGITVEVGEEVARVLHDYEDFAVDLRLFRARIVHGEPKALGCAEVRWVKEPEIFTLSLAPADQKLVQDLRERRVL